MGRLDKTYASIIQGEKHVTPTNNNIAVYFNASVEELKRAGESFENIAELTDGGYPASLGAYHQLHCVVIFFSFNQLLEPEKLT